MLSAHPPIVTTLWREAENMHLVLIKNLSVFVCMEEPCNVSDGASFMLADSSLLFVLISPAFSHLPLLVCHSACIVCR